MIVVRLLKLIYDKEETKVRKKTFKGGVHPLSHIYHGKTLTEHKAAKVLAPPKEAVIPLSRIIGKEAKPLVKKGDYVKKGQIIGEADGFISANVHASVSGTVTKVEMRPHPTGIKRLAVVIENDFKEDVHESCVPRDINKMSKDEIVQAVKDMGIVGMGGATFPTHVKFMPPKDAKIDYIILNGAECEPYLTADHRLMLEHPQSVINGLKTVMKMFDVKKGIIGIESNKQDAIDLLTSFIHDDDNINIVPLAPKYPQGAEKQLIHALTGRRVPAGGLPMEVGVIVLNVGTTAAIHTTITSGMPLIERIVTVTGSCVKEPCNLIVRFGTSFGECLEACGGLTDDTAKVISGGPMMGIAQPDTLAPVIAGTSGILALNKEETTVHDIDNCIRCARCVDACPLGLVPLQISAAADAGRLEEAKKYNAMDCVECGACTFICPSRRRLMQSIRLAKNAIRKAGK
jgi:electron transport complex protein RnfC